MKKKNEDFNLSYESDGEMGSQKSKNIQEEMEVAEEQFFNTTQHSE
ncbi:hypothetical protein [Calidifontibacillus oryziterrae]|nr:hypothetical protein [Calidifontibacillus oryziterrae]